MKIAIGSLILGLLFMLSQITLSLHENPSQKFQQFIKQYPNRDYMVVAWDEGGTVTFDFPSYFSQINELVERGDANNIKQAEELYWGEFNLFVNDLVTKYGANKVCVF